MKKKILIVSGRLGKGGAERFVSNLITYLDREKFDIILCLGTECIEYPLPSDVRISNLNNKTIFHQLRTIRRLKCVIEKEEPDTILSAIGLANRWTGVALRLLSNRSHRWIARIGNNPKFGGRSQWRNSLNLLWDKFTYKNTDHFVVNSFSLEESFLETYPHTKGRTSVHYNPTDFENISRLAQEPSPISKDKETTVLVHAGRFHRQKRHDLLLNSFAKLRNSFYHSRKIELWLCGEGYLRSEIEGHINRLQLQNSVKLLGHLGNPYPIFMQADLFLLTSDWEGMPNVLVEAMGLGVPVLSTDCPTGPSELIEDGVTGFLSPPGVEDELANCLDVILKRTPSELRNVGELGERFVKEKFDFRRNLDLWEKTLGAKFQ